MKKLIILTILIGVLTMTQANAQQLEGERLPLNYTTTNGATYFQISSNGSNYFMSRISNGLIYLLNGTYGITATSYDPMPAYVENGLCWDGTNWWTQTLIGGVSTIVQMNATFSLTGFNFTEPAAVIDRQHLWCNSTTIMSIGSNQAGRLFEFNHTGAQIRNFTTLATVPDGFYYYNNTYYISTAVNNAGRVYLYNSNGNYTGRRFRITFYLGTTTGLVLTSEGWLTMNTAAGVQYASFFASENATVNKTANITLLNVSIDLGFEPSSAIVKGDLMYAVSFNDDRLRIYNISNISAPVVLNTTTRITLPCTLDGAVGMTKVNNTLFICASVDDTISAYNVTNPSAPVCLGNYTSAVQPGSVDNCRGVDYYERNGVLNIYSTSIADDVLTAINWTVLNNPKLSTSITDSAGPCSLDGATYPTIDRNRSVSFTMGQVDSTVTVHNLTGNSTNSTLFTCISSRLIIEGTNATPQSLELVEYLYLEPSRTLLYAVSQPDFVLGVFNYTGEAVLNYSPVGVGYLDNGMGFPNNTCSMEDPAGTQTFITVYNNTLYFQNRGNATAVGGICAVNVTDPRGRLNITSYNMQTQLTCIGNARTFIWANATNIISGSGTDGCIYMYDVASISTEPPPPAQPMFNSSVLSFGGNGILSFGLNALYNFGQAVLP